MNVSIEKLYKLFLSRFLFLLFLWTANGLRWFIARVDSSIFLFFFADIYIYDK
jgi:hypothetical protein